MSGLVFVLMNKMPRTPLIREDACPYHIVVRANNSESFKLNENWCFNIFRKRMLKTIEIYDLKVHAFLLMSNHWHLLASTPRSNLDQCMWYFISHSSKDLNHFSGRHNHVFGGRYKWSLIYKQEYYQNAFRYLYQNPLRAGMVNSVQDYKWSTLGEHLKAKSLWVKDSIFSDTILSDNSQLLEWLNEPISFENNEKIKKGLRRSIFEVSGKKLRHRGL